MRRDLRAELRGKVPDDYINYVSRSFDVIGSRGKAVAIIEIPKEVTKYEVEIGEALMRTQKNVKSVLVKDSVRTGEFRLRELRLIAGDQDSEVIHKESGCRFKLDPKKVYFSPRESKERERITADVKDGENILVMFSGIAPLPICIARGNHQTLCTAVELNPVAHNYAIENVNLNKVAARVKPLLGDVRDVCLNMSPFNRVYMPLPKGAYFFLNIAVPLVRKGGVIGFYHWAPNDDLWSEAENLLNKEVKKFNRDIELIKHVKISQYNPKYWKIRIDARIY